MIPKRGPVVGAHGDGRGVTYQCTTCGFVGRRPYTKPEPLCPKGHGRMPVADREKINPKKMRRLHRRGIAWGSPAPSPKSWDSHDVVRHKAKPEKQERVPHQLKPRPPMTRNGEPIKHGRGR